MSQQPFGDIPLFRELQKLLTSDGGPVNFDIARQVAKAIASQGASGARSPEATRALQDTVHPAEVVLAGYTRLPLEEPSRAKIMDRAAWIDTTLEGWRWLLEQLAERFSGELAKLGPESGEGGNPMAAAMGPVAALLMGMQSGTLVGHLAGEALGRYDFPIPRDDDGMLLWVEPNLAAVATDYSIDQAAWGRWLALHDVARHLVLSAAPWISPYFRSLVTEVIGAIEIDVSDIQRRLVELQSQGMESLQEGMGPSAALPVVPTERHGRALDRWRAFVAVWEGYAAHSAAAVATEIVGDGASKIDEAAARHGATKKDGRAMLETIVGLSAEASLRASGATFCAAVARLKGIQALNKVWEAPDNLPSMEEIKDPFAWMERILGGD